MVASPFKGEEACPKGQGVFSILAEGAGFEPANLSVNGFQDRRLRPLGHPSGVAHLMRTGRERAGRVPIFWKNAYYPPAGILSIPFM